MEALGGGGGGGRRGKGHWASRLRATKEKGATKWLEVVGGLVDQWRVNGGELGLWKYASMALGTVVCWKEGGEFGEGEGGVWHLGRVEELLDGAKIDRWDTRVGVAMWTTEEGRMRREGRGGRRDRGKSGMSLGGWTSGAVWTFLVMCGRRGGGRWR